MGVNSIGRLAIFNMVLTTNILTVILLFLGAMGWKILRSTELATERPIDALRRTFEETVGFLFTTSTNAYLVWGFSNCVTIKCSLFRHNCRFCENTTNTQLKSIGKMCGLDIGDWARSTRWVNLPEVANYANKHVCTAVLPPGLIL